MSRKKYPFAKYFFVVILGCYVWASLVNRLAICPCGKKQRVIKFTNTNCIIHNEISQLRYDRESLVNITRARRTEMEFAAIKSKARELFRGIEALSRRFGVSPALFF